MVHRKIRFVAPAILFGWLALAGLNGPANAQEAKPAEPAAAAPAAPAVAPAGEAAKPAEPPKPKIDSGDTAWVLTSSALVMLMTLPGLALFYGGLVRRKNALSTIMHSFIILCLISVQWVLWGYTLAFGPDIKQLIGGLDFLGLKGMNGSPSSYANTIPDFAFMIFQAMFAVITPALITGAFAERIKFSAFIIFTLLWATIVYDPLAHWVWGRRLAPEARRARLRRRDGRPHQLRRLGARGGHRDRQAQGAREGDHGAA